MRERRKRPSSSSTCSSTSLSNFSQPPSVSSLKSEQISCSSDLNEEDYRSFLPLPGSAGQIQLWQFLLELLDCPDKFKEIIDPFLSNNNSTSSIADPSTASFDPLSPKPSPASVASPDPPSFDQFSPPYPPPEEIPCRQKKQRVVDTRPPPPSYEETMALRRNQESQKLQDLLNSSEMSESFQQRSYSFNDLLQDVPENEFGV